MKKRQSLRKKKILRRKRSDPKKDKGFEAKHINYPIEPKYHTAMYMMHKYWARKPHNVVREYIEHYTKKNEIVLDPFCGSGVTAIEAIKAGRKAIAIDLNPIATFITKMTAIPVDLDKLKVVFEDLKRNVQEKIYSFYEIKCPLCKGNANTISAVWSYVVKCPYCNGKIVMAKAKRPKDKKQNIYICYNCNQTFSYGNQKIVKEVPIQLKYICSKCGKKDRIENPDIRDDTDINKYWYPKINLYYAKNKPFMTKRRAGNITELFTNRNIACMSILLDAIEGIRESLYQDLMKFTFSSMIPQASRLMIWTETSGPSWKMPEYIVFAKHQELNVWDRFENRFKAVYRGKVESNNEIPYFKEANTFKTLENDANFMVITKSALELTKGRVQIPNERISYVFTDPPYGGDIQYFELDHIRLAWLQGKNNDERFSTQWWKDEVTINSSGQDKDFSYYHKMMCAAFEQIHRCLIKDRWMTVTFHSTDVKTYTSILTVNVLAGFKTEKVIYQPPSVISVKAQAQPYGSAVGDYYIRFKKPSRSGKIAIPAKEMERYERAVVQNAIRIIAERSEPTPLTILLMMYPKLKAQGVLLGAKQRIDEVLKKYVDDVFVIVDNKWWLKEPEKYLIHVIPLDERIERVVIDTLFNKIKVSFDDIVRKVYTRYFNSLTPSHSIRNVLEEYAEKTFDKKWRLKTRVKHKVSEHSKMIGMLAEIGERLNFRIHIGRKEQSDTYKGKKLQHLVDKKPVKLHKRVSNIDVLWHRKQKMHYAFEVEYTTGITEAVLRGYYITPDTVQRVFVIPKERSRFLYQKISNPILKKRISEQGWKFVYFVELVKFYEEFLEKNIKMSVEDFEKLFKALKDAKIEKKGKISQLQVFKG